MHVKSVDLHIRLKDNIIAYYANITGLLDYRLINGLVAIQMKCNVNRLCEVFIFR